jgi:hypothetical protein
MSFKLLRFLLSSVFQFFACSPIKSKKKGPPKRTQFLEGTNDTGYLLSSTRDAIMLYEPALKKMRPRTRTVLAFTGVTFRLVPLTIDTAMVD